MVLVISDTGKYTAKIVDVNCYRYLNARTLGLDPRVQRMVQSIDLNVVEIAGAQ
ncbi:hypothetical protein [Pseudomonas delhiensis]|uniref:hypothetical protein n=1 Tax=Pseudomonas delhiensis TaxID=366289 RepID=UPI0014288C02|nr:hypothetical protein [Pseudomonas delhiensis]